MPSGSMVILYLWNNSHSSLGSREIDEHYTVVCDIYSRVK